MSINVSLGTTKSKSESNSTTTVANASEVKAGGDVNVTSTKKDINITGSNVEGKDVTLNAKENLNITASETTNKLEQNSKSSSASVGASLELGKGLSYSISGSMSKGEVSANGTTYNESTVTANKDLSFASGKDTSIKGGELSGEKLTGNVGKDLNIESKQDSNSYKEKNKSVGVSVGLGSNKAVSGSASVGKIDSKYASVTDQSGIYAGEDGFDIRVEDNTDLKGGIISSTADADKNKLSTGTLTFEDIQNKADYKAGGAGVKVNKNNNADYNEKGITPDIGVLASGEAESTTKATISKGTIEIRDTDKQKQDIENLNRDTNNSLNKLGEIFDKTKIEERQELANLFGELAYNEIHYMDGSNEQKALYHAVVGGIMSKLTGGDFLAGATAAGINKLVIEEIVKVADGDPDKAQWVSAALGAVISGLVSGNVQAGASTAASGTKNNELYIWQEKEKEEELEDLIKKGDYLGYDLKDRMYKQLSDANQLYDLDGSYLSDKYNTDTITEEKKKEYLQYVTPYLQHSLEDQYIKTVAVRAKKALNENRNNMKANEVYIFSDSIKIPIKIKGNELLYINYTTVVTKNGYMILAPGTTISIPKTGESLLPFSSEVYKGPVRNVDFNSNDIDRDIVNIIRGYSGSFSGSMIGAGTLSISSDGTLTNYGTGVSIENVGGLGLSFNGGKYIGNIKDYS